MDNLAGISAFVRSAETCSYVEAGRLLGVSASAIGKSIVRLEGRLGVRLFHRNTRSMKLTAEGALFLQRCERILGEIDAAERELTAVRGEPRGKLRVSVPSVGKLLRPPIAEFMQKYPDVELDLDFTDRKVDLIDEGFDAVVRIGGTDDSRLMSRKLGMFDRYLVASPGYLKREGKPKTSSDLRSHSRLLYKFPNSGKVEAWPLEDWDELVATNARTSVLCNSIDTLTYLALHGRGIACLPDFEVGEALAGGRLERVLPNLVRQSRPLTILWPTSKHLAPKLRVFIDVLSERLFTSKTA
ncbi:LysR family transcriptional regulator [Paraburkholderia tropica]|uniref:LysR family transcriptional regulator n=1 Tax=Paraburkholderia tropica TaxID=92647 RepID=UPI0031D978FD